MCDKIKEVLFHWRQGRKDGFPICCIVRFIIQFGNAKQARQRGVRYTDFGVYFVPCQVLHRAHRTVESHWRA